MRKKLIQKEEMYKKKKIEEKSSLSLNNASLQDRQISDVIMVNLIAAFAVGLSAFIPLVSLGIPFLLLIYFETGVLGFVLEKEKHAYVKYEAIFVSLKKYLKMFCIAIIKLFMTSFFTVLLIVPGIIYFATYSFSSLILYENDDLDVKGVLMLSKELTQGFRLQIIFWLMLSAAIVCVSMTLAFFVIMLFDLFLFVPSTVYIVFVLGFGILSVVIFALPMMEIVLADLYISSKNKRIKERL